MAAANIESGSSGSDLTVKASTGTRASRAITWLVSIAGVVSLVTRLRPSKRTNSASETELDKYKRGPNDPDPFEKLHVKRSFEEKHGYPRLASFIASDPNFLIHRNPVYLRNRLILYYVAELQRIEQEIRTLDDEDAEDDEFILQSHIYDLNREGATRKRAELMEELNGVLKKYDDLLLRERTLRSFETPSDKNHRSILRFLRDERPLAASEEDPWLNKHELVSLAAGKDNSWLDDSIERWLIKLPRRHAQKIFTEPEMRITKEQERPVYFSKARISIASNVLTVVASLLTAMVPTSLLFSLRSSRAVSIIITLCAVIIFSAVLAACSRTRPQDIFIATAAFCAILVAFLSQGDDEP